MVGPVAVRAYPDLEQRRLALDDREDEVAVKVLIDGPDQTSENGEARSTLPRQPVPSPWTNACQIAAAWALVMPGRIAAHVLHRRRGDLVREPHPLDLLRRLDARARTSTASRRASGERVEPAPGERRRLADHAVGGLGAARELDRHAVVVARGRGGELERP